MQVVTLLVYSICIFVVFLWRLTEIESLQVVRLVEDAIDFVHVMNYLSDSMLRLESVVSVQ